MFPVCLGRQFYRPGAVFTDHRAGKRIAAAVFDLNGRARLPGTAKGWRVIVGDRICTQHALLVARKIGEHEGWRCALNFFRIINNFCFCFAVTTVSQQCPNSTAA